MTIADQIRQLVAQGDGLVTLADIARNEHVSHSAVRKWRQSDDWPAPIDTIAVTTSKPIELFLMADYRQWRGRRSARGQTT
jgi:uncharacterized protein YjcR